MQIKRFFQPLLETVAAPYAKKTMEKLASYGLRYDDLYDPMRDEVSPRTVAAGRAPGQKGSCGLL